MLHALGQMPHGASKLLDLRLQVVDRVHRRTGTPEVLLHLRSHLLQMLRHLMQSGGMQVLHGHLNVVHPTLDFLGRRGPGSASRLGSVAPFTGLAHPAFLQLSPQFLGATQHFPGPVAVSFGCQPACLRLDFAQLPLQRWHGLHRTSATGAFSQFALDLLRPFRQFPRGFLPSDGFHLTGPFVQLADFHFPRLAALAAAFAFAGLDLAQTRPDLLQFSLNRAGFLAVAVLAQFHQVPLQFLGMAAHFADFLRLGGDLHREGAHRHTRSQAKDKTLDRSFHDFSGM